MIYRQKACFCCGNYLHYVKLKQINRMKKFKDQKNLTSILANVDKVYISLNPYFNTTNTEILSMPRKICKNLKKNGIKYEHNIKSCYIRIELEATSKILVMHYNVVILLNNSLELRWQAVSIDRYSQLRKRIEYSFPAQTATLLADKLLKYKLIKPDDSFLFLDPNRFC